MHRRWLSRALIALVVPATLTAPALVPSATAAAKGPGVPSVSSVAKIYPHFAGGTSSESTSKVIGPGKKCKPGKAIKGASARFASYMAPLTSTDPTDFAMTGAKPGVFVSAMRFRSAKSAIAYLHKSSSSTKKCPVPSPTGDGTKVKATMSKIKFKLGDERWGYKSQVTVNGQTIISDTLFVRDGKFVVYASAMSMDGRAPSVPRAIQLTKVALQAAR
jgi:hypothetical protein